jgi:hypothetical protein
MTRICVVCGDEKPIKNFRGRGQKYLIDGTKHIYRSDTCRGCVRKQRLQSGMCPNCLRPTKPAPGFKKCAACVEVQRKSLQRHRQINLNAALKHYGTTCNYCGQSDPAYLTIDHINGGGVQFRKTASFDTMPNWLRRNNYPDGFQTLCFNCNCGKSKSGETAILQLLAERNRLTASGQARLTGILCGATTEYEKHDKEDSQSNRGSIG